MSIEYHSVGDLLPGLVPDHLTHAASRQILAACQRHPAFEVLELRRLERSLNNGQEIGVVDIVVVECCDGTIPSRNPNLIKNRERLLLMHGPGLVNPHEVRAARIDFPLTPHQNHVQLGDPASICLYFESWSAVERTWTPASHLQRILWWLRETALGTLHRSDQPLERLYFISPYKILLPSDFKDRAMDNAQILKLEPSNSRENGKILRGTFQKKEAGNVKASSPELESLVVAVPAAKATRIERYPSTLGELHEQLTTRGSELITVLTGTLQQMVSNAGIPIRKANDSHVFLLIHIPVTRNDGDAAERTDTIGFIVHKTNLTHLGLACNALFDGKAGKAYANNLSIAGLFGGGPPVEEAWRNLNIEPVDVGYAFGPKDAQMSSGFPTNSCNIRGVLAGVGALGSAMAELWNRSAWGSWTYIDDDLVQPHNVVRHTAKDMHLGWAKIDAVSHMSASTWDSPVVPKTVFAKVNDFNHGGVKDALATANLFVDATTTLEVPRDLSEKDEIPRMVSTFLTPSGRDSVLILEDLNRATRLYTLEGQYYRAILNSEWGKSHLSGHIGAYWVGAGCRDLSTVMPLEVVQLHGSTLARQVRLLSENPEAHIRVWSMVEETGALKCEVIPVEKSKQITLGEWRVIWDDGLEKKLKSIRLASLPNETGGVILGYVDQKRKAIHAVDVLPAPVDSIASMSEFTRGASGVRDAIEQAAERTANIVGYLGEWHSHPLHCSSAPSVTDLNLLATLAHALNLDGVPALMAIVGENDVSFSLGQGISV